MRKYIFAFFFLFLLVGLVGCKPTKPEGPTEEEVKEDAAISSFESIELITYGENENKDNVVSNITLLKQVDGYPIHWSSDNRVVILIDDDKGIVTQQSSDITVTLTATILVTATKNSERTITIKVLQKPLPKQYIVTFDYDEASGILPTTQTVVEGNKVIKPADPSRDGYEFVGWTLDLEFSVLFDFNTIIEEDIKLYAIWEEIEIVLYTGYYEGITSADTGLTLVNKLYNIISVVTAGNGNQNSSYGEVRYILMESDINPNNTDYLWGIYDNADIPKIWDGNTMNREHVWPNSRLGVPRKTLTNSSRGIDSDPHNLRIIISRTNTDRNNYIFVNSSPSVNGHVIPGTQTYYPGDAHRGDVARILLYMAVRYKDILKLHNNMYGENYSLNGTSFGDIKVLLQWHQEDPVDDFEIQRNDVIYEHQGNRNPFIDKPYLFEPVWEVLMESAGLSVQKTAAFNQTINTYDKLKTIYIPSEIRYII
jgi:uncharacterized repeat protein (TIGR02543 family)